MRFLRVLKDLDDDNPGFKKQALNILGTSAQQSLLVWPLYKLPKAEKTLKMTVNLNRFKRYSIQEKK